VKFLKPKCNSRRKKNKIQSARITILMPSREVGTAETNKKRPRMTFNFYFFFNLRGVSGPAYAHHDYFPRPTGHPASPGAGKAPQG
jgi:hypothetical protein